MLEYPEDLESGLADLEIPRKGLGKSVEDFQVPEKWFKNRFGR